MKKSAIILALALGISAWTALAQDQTNSAPAGTPPPAHQRGHGKADRPGGFHLLPPRAAEQLNLTDDQKKQLADLEADVKAKLEKILTSDQLQQLKEMRPPRPQGRMGGPAGAPPEGGPHGPGPRGENDPQPPAPQE